MTNKEISKKRTYEGAVQTSGIFAIITAGIEMIRYFFPDLPWSQIMPLFGAILAYFAGGKVSKEVHKRNVAKLGETNV